MVPLHTSVYPTCPVLNRSEWKDSHTANQIRSTLLMVHFKNIPAEIGCPSTGPTHQLERKAASKLWHFYRNNLADFTTLIPSGAYSLAKATSAVRYRLGITFCNSIFEVRWETWPASTGHVNVIIILGAGEMYFIRAPVRKKLLNMISQAVKEDWQAKWFLVRHFEILRHRVNEWLNSILFDIWPTWFYSWCPMKEQGHDISFKDVCIFWQMVILAVVVIDVFDYGHWRTCLHQSILIPRWSGLPGGVVIRVVEKRSRGLRFKPGLQHNWVYKAAIDLLL